MRANFAATDWNTVEVLLDDWFSAGLNRRSTLTFDSSKSSWDSALLAASLFKRGAHELRCPRSEEVRSLSVASFGYSPSPSSTTTRVHAHSDELFADPIFSAPSTAVLCDANLLRCHPKIEKHLSKSPVTWLKIECSEERKTLLSVRNILAALPTDTQHLVIIGGGICCDVGGLVGGLRGCHIRLVPTTLLAAVDAGLGGKTGVNHPRAGKNQIGLFVTLERVDVVTEFLTTLQAPQVHEGCSEILKHAFLAGTFELWRPALFKLQQQAISSGIKWADYHWLLLENLEFKKKVTKHDPFENGIRALLNYGHTTAHLLESLFSAGHTTSLRSPLSHGSAVALGQLCFLQLGWASEAPEGYRDVLSRLVQNERIDLPVCSLNNIAETARNLLLQDKKNTGVKDSELVRCVTPHYGCLRNLDTLAPAQHALLVEKNTARVHVRDLLLQLKKAGLFS